MRRKTADAAQKLGGVKQIPGGTSTPGQETVC